MFVSGCYLFVIDSVAIISNWPWLPGNSWFGFLAAPASSLATIQTINMLHDTPGAQCYDKG